MENLFAYGTLMSETIMHQVSGCLPPHEPATLADYSRHAVRGELYPAIVARAGGRVDGVVYRMVDMAAWERLDRFEGERYARQPVTIVLADGSTLTAATYVARPELIASLAQEEWDFANFLRHGMTSFQRHYQGYQALEALDRPRNS